MFQRVSEQLMFCRHKKQPLSLSYFYLKAWGKQTPPVRLKPNNHLKIKTDGVGVYLIQFFMMTSGQFPSKNKTNGKKNNLKKNCKLKKSSLAQIF